MLNKRAGAIVTAGGQPPRQVPDRDAATRQRMRAEAEPLLTPRQFQVFCLRYGLDGEPPLKVVAIATCLGLSYDTTKQYLIHARIRFARLYEVVPPRERVRRYLLLGWPIPEDFLAFHAQLDAERLCAVQPDLPVATLTGALPPESIYALLPPVQQALYRATLQTVYQARGHVGEETTS